MGERRSPVRLFAVRVTTGQEMGTALTANERYLRSRELQRSSIASVVVFGEVKSYIFVEASNVVDVNRMFYGLRYVKHVSQGYIDYDEVKHLVAPKLAATMIEPGYDVEIVGGPFKGLKARVMGVDRNKNEVTVILLEANYTFPLTMSAEQVKVIKKPEGESGERS